MMLPDRLERQAAFHGNVMDMVVLTQATTREPCLKRIFDVSSSARVGVRKYV